MKEPILFYGSPDFAVECLDHLIKSNFNIIGVVTAVDKKSGRGQKLKFSPVKQFALHHQIPIFQPSNLKSPEFQSSLEKLNPTLHVVVAFRMLPKSVWNFPDKGTINLHSSLLPDYRGAAPIHWVIINGERYTGVSTFIIDEKIDTGKILRQKKIEISTKETFGSLYEKLLNEGKVLLEQTIKGHLANQLKAKAQKSIGITKKAPKLNPENTRIDWTKSLKDIQQLIRGLDPIPGAWTYFENGRQKNLRMKILKAETRIFETDHRPNVFKIEKQRLLITHRDGLLECIQIQIQGKKAMDSRSLLNGYRFLDHSKVN
ncbi:MAG: methionyl-tRNA formyltransferase [Flavobacteriaceae bacterium]|nr:methionyl-tRNA formyltransferase [Flavobacteriaceae bacterium]